jgi:transposase
MIMGRSVSKVKGYKAEQIKDLIDENQDYKTAIRLYAVYQKALGKTSRQIAALYHVTFKQVLNWVHQFEEEGVEGLIDEPGRGRKSRLSEDQKEEISKLLTEKLPSDCGYNSATWTGSLLRDWVKTHFDIAYKQAQIYNILSALGFSHQKAKGFYPQADQQAQEEFKTALKKTRAITP